MTKLSLHITFSGKGSVCIKLMNVDPIVITKHLTDGNEHHTYQNRNNRYLIWSADSFSFCGSFFRLPQDNYLKPDTQYTYNFFTDELRKEFLKKLYDTLQLWSCNRKLFKSNASDERDKNVSMKNEFWFVY